MPTSQQGTAAWCPPLKAGASLRRNSGVLEETPHASGLAAGFFFSGRRNQVAAIRIALAWKDLLESPLGILPQAPPPAGNRGCFFGAAVSAAAQRPRRALRLYRGHKTPSQKCLDPPAQAETAQNSDSKESKARSRDLASIPAPD